MLQFLTPIDATMTSFTGRTEKHGDEDVPAVSCGLKITGANTLLDLISPTLRQALYKAVEDQDQLPGVEVATPVLRSKDIDTIPLDITYEGWTVTIEHGIGDDSAIVLGDAKVDVKRIKLYEGGTVDISVSFGSSDVDAEEAGLLWAKQKRMVSVMLKAPEVPKDQPVIDGTGADFQAAHPLFEDAPEAGDVFAAAHLSSDDADSNTGDEAFAGTADPAGDDVAEFEAGAAHAVAGLKPARRGATRH
jgi:hypothetical protein